MFIDLVWGGTGPRIGFYGIPLRIWLWRVIKHTHNTFNDIVDIGKVSLHFTVVKHIDRFFPPE